MARQKGANNFAGTLEVLAAAPLDARSIVPTKADLTASANFPYPYVGMEVYVTAENKKYRLTANDPTTLSNWEEVGAGGAGGGHTIEDPEGTALTQRDTLQFGGDLEVSDDDENEKTVVAPHELTAAELTEIMSTLPGQPTQGITIDLRGNEQVVGKVIESDGTEKTLYQKTVDCGALPNKTNKTVLHNISNLDTIINYYGFAKRSNHSILSLPFIGGSINNCIEVSMYPIDTSIYINTGTDYSSWNGYITLQYTKTTS